MTDLSSPSESITPELKARARVMALMDELQEIPEGTPRATEIFNEAIEITRAALFTPRAAGDSTAPNAPSSKYTPSEFQLRSDAALERLYALEAERWRTPTSDEDKRDDLNRQIWEQHLLIQSYGLDEARNRCFATGGSAKQLTTAQRYAPANAAYMNAAKLMVEFYSTPRENVKRRSEIGRESDEAMRIADRVAGEVTDRWGRDLP